MSLNHSLFQTPQDIPKASTSFNYIKYLDLGDYPENMNYLNFPFFPLKVDSENDFEYHDTMRETLTFVERWIYSQGFFKTHYYRIPYTIALPPIIKVKDMKKDTVIEPPILTFLVELGGEQVREASISRYFRLKETY